ncbi:MAG: hypothetical protein NC548_05560 [Lachnospiraceae bacterium]|nr:hypothetical protein [Lachnospiraceae bacterium]
MKFFKAIANFFKGIVDSIKAHFERRGIVDGVKDIAEGAVAIGLTVTVAKIAVTKLKLYWDGRGKKSSAYDVPFDVIRASAREQEKARKNKAELRKAKKEDRDIRHEAVDRLSKDRDKYFRELPYRERRSILEAEGNNLEDMEQTIRIERQVDAQIQESIEKRKRASKSVFQRFQRFARRLLGETQPVSNII